MKKVLLRVMTALFAFVLCFSAVSCKVKDEWDQPKYDPASPDSIKIVIPKLGFGIDWLYAIAKAFMTTHPGKSVTVEKTALSSSLMTQLKAGSKIGDIAMFNDDSNWKVWREGLLTQIDDVVNATPDGEDKSIYEKMNRNLIDAYKVADGHYYSVPWINENYGTVYNATALNTLLGAGNWSLPKTTNEMNALCERIKTAGGYGFVWNSDYLESDIWAAQYNGNFENEKYLSGYYYDGTDWKISPNAECAEQNIGYLKSLEVLEKVVKDYSHPYTKNMSHINAQSAWAGIPFAGEKKPSVFMPNGDWTYNESKDLINKTQAEVGFMRSPVISSLVERLDFYADGTAAFSSLSADKQAAYDATLVAVIDYIDGGSTGTVPKHNNVTVSQDDIDKVTSARQIVGAKSQSQAFIPHNSTKKELAKEFLIFMASDIAIDTFSKYTYGFSPFIGEDNYDKINFGVPFMNDVVSVLKAAPNKTIMINYQWDITTAGYLRPKVVSYQQGLSAKTAQKFFDDDVERFKTDWTNILRNAGLSSQVTG